MAKWGEGDPRWIVEERPDATNVNNWHWTEKDASHWSKEKLKDLFCDLVIEGDIGKCHVTEVSKIEGEASANNRKAKLIFFYEWNIRLEWKGRVNGCTEDIEGQIEIPNLSEENSADEIDVEVTVKDKSDKADLLKQMIYKTGVVTVRDKIAQYIKGLKEEFGSGMILPGKDQIQKETKVTTQTNWKSAEEKTTTGIKKLDISSGKLSTTQLDLRHTFKCRAQDFYRALTVPEMVQAFSQGPCKVDAHVGGEFEMFGGNVSGKFTSLIPDKIVEQTWRFKQWPNGHFSNVRFEIDEKEDCTEVSLTQTGVPENDIERTREGWLHYYWESIKKTFGFGAMLI